MYYISIDNNSNDAIYVQIRNQIVMDIANDLLHEGDSLPSVRQLSEAMGINMHTVNKAYGILVEEGLVVKDGRRGTIISIDIDKLQALRELDRDLRIVLAKAVCKNVTRAEAHELVDAIYDKYLSNS